ncbi:hypothetical protein JCM18918_1981 [Cutibacterium acnes JCM 18918]|nr:hypothetical protein JCM18918_1981 [Cutibacterium acnes JCM 18918]
MSDRRSVDDHRDYLCSLVQAVPPVAVEVPRAVGLAVCEDVHAPHDVPVVTTAVIDATPSTRRRLEWPDVPMPLRSRWIDAHLAR